MQTKLHLISDGKWHLIFQDTYFYDFYACHPQFLLFQNILLTFFESFFKFLKSHQHLSHSHSLQGLTDSITIMLSFTFFYQSLCLENEEVKICGTTPS